MQPEETQQANSAAPPDTQGSAMPPVQREAAVPTDPPTSGDSEYASFGAAPSPVDWTASEYVYHAKGPGWFLLLAGGALVLLALIYLLIRDVVAVVLLAVAGIAFGVFANRKPRVLAYRVDEHGITVGQKHYPFTDFKSFSVAQDGPLHTVSFMPLRRFMPPLSIYYDPQDEDAILDVIAASLPFDRRPADPIDRLMSKLHF